MKILDRKHGGVRMAETFCMIIGRPVKLLSFRCISDNCVIINQSLGTGPACHHLSAQHKISRLQSSSYNLNENHLKT